EKGWLSKNDGKAAAEEFKEAFERKKKEGLFKGLEELHEKWGELAETGSHATLNAMADRFVQIESADHIDWNINYSGAEASLWALSLFTMLLTGFTMEDTLFRDYEDRLKLDPELMRMRSKFQTFKESLRRT